MGLNPAKVTKHARDDGLPGFQEIFVGLENENDDSASWAAGLKPADRAGDWDLGLCCFHGVGREL